MVTDLPRADVRIPMSVGLSHSGRRSFISKLAHNGVSPKVIMTLAGHRHLTTTQRYIDVNDEMLRKDVNLV